MEWTKQQYNKQYDRWVPWLEDLYLRWFTKDNKTSYTAKQNLDKTKVTGIKQVDTVQDGVHGLATGQLGQGGLLQPVSDITSREGVNRVERKGRDEKGNYVTDPTGGVVTGIADGGRAAAGKTAEGLKGAGGYAADGARNVGGAVSGLFGGGGGKKQSSEGV